MSYFKIEFSKAAYIADFVAYLFIPVLLFWGLMYFGPQRAWPKIVGSIVGGLFVWTLLEYLLHRYVLHGLEPFRHWHLVHHRRPYALIGTPTVLSLILFVVCIFVPAWLIGNLWTGAGFTLGVVTGYAIYSWTHHAIHHWRANAPWLIQRKRQHAIHHHSQKGCGYGVITSFWDHVFGTAVDD